MRCLTTFFAFLLPLLLLSTTAGALQIDREPETPLPTGPWSASLMLGDGNVLYFELEIERAEDGTYRSFVLNADERIEVPATHWHLTKKDEPRLQLLFPHYDAAIRARMRSDRRSVLGWWTKGQGDEDERRLQFVATAGAADRFPPVVTPGKFVNIAGRWKLAFEDAEDPAVLVLEQAAEADHVQGTLLTTTGDYRFLEGRIDRGYLRLSTFDGAHAFLFTGRVEPDGSLGGNFKSGTWYETAWTAERDETATLPPPLAATSWLEGAKLGELMVLDAEGNAVPLVQRSWSGRPAVVSLFGTWCPNCHDEAELLNELDQRFGPEGLLVLGLAFELPGGVERARQQLELFRERHATTYPMRLAGWTPKAASARALGTLDELRAYPTTLFVRRDGTIAAVHTGFLGPATGAEHAAERARFEEQVEAILASPPFDAAAARAAFGDAAWTGPTGELAPPAEADFAPGGLWRGDEWLALDLAHGVAWNPLDPDVAFLSPGRPAAKLGVDALRAPDFARRRAALFALTLGRGQEPLPEALALLADPVPLVKTIAAWALGRTRAETATEQLSELVDDAHAPLAREARRALGRM